MGEREIKHKNRRIGTRRDRCLADFYCINQTKKQCNTRSKLSEDNVYCLSFEPCNQKEHAAPILGLWGKISHCH